MIPALSPVGISPAAPAAVIGSGGGVPRFDLLDIGSAPTIAPGAGRQTGAPSGKDLPLDLDTHGSPVEVPLLPPEYDIGGGAAPTAPIRPADVPTGSAQSRDHGATAGRRVVARPAEPRTDDPESGEPDIGSDTSAIVFDPAVSPALHVPALDDPASALPVANAGSYPAGVPAADIRDAASPIVPSGVGRIAPGAHRSTVMPSPTGGMADPARMADLSAPEWHVPADAETQSLERRPPPPWMPESVEARVRSNESRFHTPDLPSLPADGAAIKDRLPPIPSVFADGANAGGSERPASANAIPIAHRIISEGSAPPAMTPTRVVGTVSLPPALSAVAADAIADSAGAAAPVSATPWRSPVDGRPAVTPIMPGNPVAGADAPRQADVARAVDRTPSVGIADAPVAIALPERAVEVRTVAVEAQRAIATPPQAAFALLTGTAARLFGEAIHRAATQAFRRDADDPAMPIALSAIQSVAAPSPIIAVTGAAINMRAHDWPHTMVDRIEMLRDAANAADTGIRLHPDALGTVDVTIHREGETVHVHLAVEQSATRQLLADAQPRLAELAEARGLRLGQTSVDAGTSGQPGQHGRAPVPTPQTLRAPASLPPAEADPEVASARIA